jgi:hypothetical protein
MQRREFLAASTAAAIGVFAAGQSSRAAELTERQVIDLRVYHFASAEKQAAYEKFLAEAAIPAYNRAGVEPVGVFKAKAADNKGEITKGVRIAEDNTDLYVLLTHKSGESVVSFEYTLAADAAFQAAGKGILDAPQKDPAFTRYESTILFAFDQCPTVQSAGKSPTRLIQLRCYESHDSEKALKKIHMFNEGGEIAIFKRCGMTPVFFGQALAGAKLPNLTYALGFDDEAAQKAAWGKFGKDPDWQKISKAELYKDTVSNITNIILRPAAGSQI